MICMHKIHIIAPGKGNVDLSINHGEFTGRVSGMHGGFHPDVPITYLEGIKPKLVRRSNWDTWSIAENLGVTVVELLSRGPYGTEDCNIINWKNHIVNVVNKAKTYKGTVNYQYDIWNESNRSEFWSGNCGNWYDWWEYAYNLIKSEKDGLDQNVAIVGPSYSNFSFSIF